MSASAVVPGSTSSRRAGRWAAATLGLTVGAFVVTIALAPSEGAGADRLLTVLLFVGSSMHVASTGWFYAVPEVRAHARANPVRYLVAPVVLVVATAAASAAVPEPTFRWALLAFFAWQFFHFQKQNLGLTALAASARSAPSLSRDERAAIVACGCLGIAGLLLRPQLLDLRIDVDPGLLPSLVFAAYGCAVLGGLLVLRRRPRADRSGSFTALFVVSLLFFTPVFVFDSPYAAVSGIVVAHGLQYLLLVVLVANGATDPTGRIVGLVVLGNVALLGGVALATASHLHGGDALARGAYGAFLGVVMAHFVVDAGLWRLRDRFPRAFLGERLPDLIPRR